MSKKITVVAEQFCTWFCTRVCKDKGDPPPVYFTDDISSTAMQILKTKDTHWQINTLIH
jgi:hypothetical protein